MLKGCDRILGWAGREFGVAEGARYADVGQSNADRRSFGCSVPKGLSFGCVRRRESVMLCRR